MEEKNITCFEVFPLGFSAFEKSTMEMFFRLSTHASPRWVVAQEMGQAAVVLICATHANDIHRALALLQPWQKALLVGESDFGTGRAFVPRPIRLNLILKQLNAMVGQKLTGAPLPNQVATAANFAAFTEQDFAKTRPGTLEMSRRKPAIASTVSAYLSRTPAREISDRRVLVVDDSDVALRFMQNRLRHFGYESSLARSGEEALTLVAAQEYRFVFLDVMMAGLDGYQTCRAIKQNKRKGLRVPVVVMLTSRGGTIDKIRGTMAGCDAYLTKPLSDRQLAAVIVKHDAGSASVFGEGGSVVDMGVSLARPIG